MSYTKLRETLAEGLETAYKIPGDDIANILPENEADFNSDNFKTFFLDKDKERVETLGLKGKDKFEQGYSKAKKETLAGFEKEVKEAFGIDDDDLIGIDLVKKVVELNSKKISSDPSKLTDEQLHKHPSVIALLSKKEQDFIKRETELKTTFEDYKKTFERKETFNDVSKKALSIFNSMNPILSEDANKAENQRKDFIAKLQGYDFQKDGENYIPLKEGKRLEDAHGHGVSFDAFVKNNANLYYDFKKADDRSTPPAGGGSGGGGGTQKFKTEQEYAKYVTDSSIPREDRVKAQEEWSKQVES